MPKRTDIHSVLIIGAGPMFTDYGFRRAPFETEHSVRLMADFKGDFGARLYSNDPAQPPYVQGFFEGMVAALLVYDRALTSLIEGLT